MWGLGVCMRRTISRGMFLVALFLFLWNLSGCNFLSGSKPMESGIAGNAPEGVGSLKFQMVLPQEPNPPLGGVRAATGSGTCTVTFRVILGNPGNTSNLTQTLTRTVPVNPDGSANTIFPGLPLKPVVALINIGGGALRRLH
ncbi:MAG: hypothetical protein HQM09_08885 [Candidatus Riflebacteria bacterium]|nr:hypothetical protein [Candidatus Riflebacteria bacterium]